MSRQPRRAKGSVSKLVRPFMRRFHESNGRYPSVGEVISAFPELESAKMAVDKVLYRWSSRTLDEVAPSKSAKQLRETELNEAKKSLSEPPKRGQKGLENRLRNVRWMLEVLEYQAHERNQVDAVAYDKLTRLERQLSEWAREDRVKMSQETLSDNNPTFEAILKDARRRRDDGKTKGGPRNDAQRSYQ